MGTTDSIPVVSQVKSVVQVLSGDEEGARQTQENFSRRCVVISQVRSKLLDYQGDVATAAEIRTEFNQNLSLTLNGVANSLPVVGHVKGGVHYMLGDDDAGDQAMKMATRTVGIVTGGIIGMIGGPAGAFAGGVMGGTAVDGMISAIDKPHGIIAAMDDITTRANENKPISGAVFDTAFGIVGDGLAGVIAGRVTQAAAKSAASHQATSGTQVAAQTKSVAGNQVKSAAGSAAKSAARSAAKNHAPPPSTAGNHAITGVHAKSTSAVAASQARSNPVKELVESQEATGANVASASLKCSALAEMGSIKPKKEELTEDKMTIDSADNDDAIDEAWNDLFDDDEPGADEAVKFTFRGDLINLRICVFSNGEESAYDILEQRKGVFLLKLPVEPGAEEAKVYIVDIQHAGKSLKGFPKIWDAGRMRRPQDAPEEQGEVEEKSQGEVEEKSQGEVEEKSQKDIEEKSQGEMEEKSQGEMAKSQGEMEEKSQEEVEEKLPHGEVETLAQGEVEQKLPQSASSEEAHVAFKVGEDDKEDTLSPALSPMVTPYRHNVPRWRRPPSCKCQLIVLFVICL